MKIAYKSNEADVAAQGVTPQEKATGVDLRRCTEEEFWQEVKYSGCDSCSER